MSTDFGNAEERAAALQVALACKSLNLAISQAADTGVNVKIIDAIEDWDDYSILQIHRMERRATILPTASGDEP